MDKVILIQYGELTTKKQNRNQFIKILEKNIRNVLVGEEFTITHSRVRMFIHLASYDRIDEVIQKLRRVFGIHRIVVCYQCHNNIEVIKENVLKIAQKEKFYTFKVETKRSNKSYDYSSMEMNQLIGALLLKNIPNIKVDVRNPEYLLKIEIREEDAYIYGMEYLGAGGYPTSVAGKGLLMLSGGIDSPVAGYLAMKRGIQLECIYFESPPHTSQLALDKVKKLVSVLREYQGDIILHIVRFTDIQEAIYKNVPSSYMITIMRRMMYRICEKVMRQRKCLVLINGESVGQVASQTLESLSVINSVTSVPVIRPVSCLDKLEIIDLSRKVGTYDISILPYEDCCTIFLPKHPVIHPDLEKAVLYEKSFSYEDLIDEAISSMQDVKINSTSSKFNF